MDAVRLFEDAICPFNKVIGCIKALDVAAIFEKAQLDRTKGQELTVFRFQDCDQVKELFPVFQKILIRKLFLLFCRI